MTLTGGEPTMWRHWDDAMAASRQLLRFTSLHVITNATAIAPKRLTGLGGGNVARVSVSLDGVADVHDANRGDDRFRAAVDGLRALREVVDNITVISVLDASTFERWPELTDLLVELRVGQHHLAPVCFAGAAMDNYRGLNREQFDQVRQRVDSVNRELPAGFRVRFNDGLVHPLTSRRMTISGLVEVEQGLQISVLPDGEVRSAVRYWGRSWRADEALGHVGTTAFRTLLTESGSRRAMDVRAQFSVEEELRRKFHLGADTVSIAADRSAVEQHTPAATRRSGPKAALAVTAEQPATSLLDPGWLREDPEAFDRCVRAAATAPVSVRLRIDRDVGFFFDAVTSDVTILTAGEADELRRRVPPALVVITDGETLA